MAKQAHDAVTLHKRTDGQPRFDVDALRRCSGEQAFARGEEYYHDNEVQIIALEPVRVLAKVSGSEDYRTEVTGRHREIGGSCSCPAFTDWGFCKHMVATALAANAVRGDAATAAANPLSRIRDYLKKKDIDALVAMIVDLAERDLDLFHKLEMAATVVDADDKALEARLRKAIDRATRIDNYIDYREAPDWVAGIDAVLDTVADLPSSGRAALALKLVERAIERIGRAFENIDDSDGDLGVLLERARDIHLAAAGAARPDPVQFARKLFACEMTDDFGTFVGAVGLYAEVLGETGLAEYRRLATKAWDGPTSRKDDQDDDDLAVGRHQVKNKQTTYVATLRAEFGRRRNFMKLLG
jgi:hypothetical protein